MLMNTNAAVQEIVEFWITYTELALTTTDPANVFNFTHNKNASRVNYIDTDLQSMSHRS